MKSLSVTEMSDNLPPICVGFKKAKLHAIERRNNRQRAIVHHLGGFSTQDPLPVQLAFLQVRYHEARHIGAGR